MINKGIAMALAAAVFGAGHVAPGAMGNAPLTIEVEPERRTRCAQQPKRIGGGSFQPKTRWPAERRRKRKNMNHVSRRVRRKHRRRAA